MENLLEGGCSKHGKLTVGKESVHQDVLRVAVVALLLVAWPVQCMMLCMVVAMGTVA